ncbi:McrC family protein [Microbacterium sp. YY-01]|uniref:McrC family protein n=1 Tax=Microbacterium sp. YY-01 TaxID=3421634 RepID=UPI003D179EC8
MTHIRRFTLRESFEPFALPLTEAQLHALKTSQLVKVVSAGSEAVLQSNGRVGAVRVGDLQIEVWPKQKVKLSHLIFMLGYATDPGFRSDVVEAEEYDELWPLLAESLARQTEQALLAGVLQGYETKEESSLVVRGRIRVVDQLRQHPGHIWPIEISYDEYMADIPENRIVRTALRRMRAVPRLNPALASRLAHLDNRLDGVSVLRPGLRLPSWRPSRMNARYVSALRLAELVLRNMSAQVGDDGVEIASFVVEMWRVFEDFVTAALREAIAAHGRRAESQREWLFDTDRTDNRARIAMSIDLLEYDGQRPVMVYDAKYKAASNTGRYANADLYQMLAYCTTVGLERAVLVYAQGGDPVDRRVMNSAVTIREWPLDLSASPDEMLRSMWRAVAGASQPLARVSASRNETGFTHA